MPTYDVTSSDGQTLTITGDVPPTAEDLDHIFKQTSLRQELARQQSRTDVAGFIGRNLPDEQTWQAFKQGAAKGAASAVKGIGAVMALSHPASDTFGAPIPAEALGPAPQNSQEAMEAIQSNPIYQFGKTAEETASQTYPVDKAAETTFPVRAAQTAGSFLPLIASGPAAPGTIGLQVLGEHLDRDYQDAISQGMSEEDAASRAIGRGIASGATQSTIFAALPAPLRKVVDSQIASLGKSAISKFVAGRAAMATEGAALGAASQVGENIVNQQPLTTDLGQAATGMAAINALMPGRGPARRPDDVQTSEPIPQHETPLSEPNITELPTDSSTPGRIEPEGRSADITERAPTEPIDTTGESAGGRTETTSAGPKPNGSTTPPESVLKAQESEFSPIERKKALDSMEPIQIDSTIGDENDLEGLRNNAKEAYRTFAGSDIVNDWTQQPVHFGMSGFKEMKFHSANPRVMQIVPELPMLMKKAVLLWSEKPTDPNQPNIKAFHHFGAQATLNGEPIYTRLLVKEDNRGRLFYDGDVTSAETLKQDQNSLQNQKPNLAGDQIDPAKNKLYQWYHSVKDEPVESQVPSVTTEPIVPKTIEHPYDVLDAIEENGIKISLPSAQAIQEDFKPTGSVRNAFTRTGGYGVDDVLQMLRNSGQFTGIASEDDLLTALRNVDAQRKSAKTESKRLNNVLNEQAKQHEAFQDQAVDGNIKGDIDKVPLDQLLPGDEFEIGGEKLKVKNLETDEDGYLTAVEVEDGSKFGVQRLAPDQVDSIHVDKGSLKSKPITFTQSEQPKTFAMASGTAPKPTPLPKPKVTVPPEGIQIGRDPKMVPIIEQFKSAQRSFQNVFAPQNIDPTAKLFALVLRQNNGRSAADLARADEAMSVWRKAFDKTPVQRDWNYKDGEPLPHNYAVIDAMERDRSALPVQLARFADTMDHEFEWRIKEVRSLAPESMNRLIQNYFPHIWQNPDGMPVRAFMAEVASRSPLHGSKGFLKQRTIPFFAEGLRRGLIPATDNPVDMVLAKLHQMDKFIMAERTLQEAKARGWYKYLPLGQQMPEGWKIVDDPAFTVYTPPVLEVKEAFDAGIRTGLMNFIKKMGWRYNRVAKLGVNTWGQYTNGVGKIETRQGAPDFVIMHEIGHGLQERYKLYEELTDGNPQAALEMGKLAAMRSVGVDASLKFKRYAQTTDERIANAVHAYIYAPELMSRTAPNVQRGLQEFISVHPELMDLNNIKPSLAIASAKIKVPLNGPVLAGHWILPDGAAQVLKNHLSPGLMQYFPIVDKLRAGSNILNGAQLGLSAFHVGFTSLDATFSTLGTAITEASRGNIARAGELAAKSIVAPVGNFMRGKAVQRAILDPASVTDPQIKAIAELAVKAGLRATVDPFWKTQFTRNFVRAWHQTGIEAKIDVAKNLPLAVVEQTIRPIAEYIVPRQKLGVFATLAESEIRHIGPQATGDEVRLAIARAADMTENRMGQMTYDNLFYNRIMKDSLLLGFRAYGWQLGKYRELFGVLGDTTQFAKQAATFQKPEFSNRMGYAVALVMGSAIIGGIMHRIFTGENPQTVMDYFHPSIGQSDAHGKPIRLSLPTYMKDLESDWHDFPDVQKMGTSFYHKLNPALAIAVDLYRNRDFYDTKIRQEDDPAYQKAYDSLKYALGAAKPFSITGAQKISDDNGSPAQFALPFFGFVTAKKAITMSPAETKAAEIMQDMMPQGSRTRAQFEHSQMVKQLITDIRRDPALGSQNLALAQSTNGVSASDMSRIESSLTLTPLQYQVHKMNLDNAMKIWDLANSDERNQLKYQIAEKISNSKTIDSSTKTLYLKAVLQNGK